MYGSAHMLIIIEISLCPSLTLLRMSVVSPRSVVLPGVMAKVFTCLVRCCVRFAPSFLVNIKVAAYSNSYTYLLLRLHPHHKKDMHGPVA